MGLISQIADAREKKYLAPQPPEPAPSPTHRSTAPPPVHPCPACESPLLWISPYDLTLRCRECQPPPSRSLMRGLFAVVPGELGGPERLMLIAGEDPGELAASRTDQATALAESSSSNPREPARNLPDWMFSPPVNFGAGKSQAQPGECTRCRSTEFRDVEIHAGRSTRRECSRCGFAQGFSKWHGEPCNPLAGLPTRPEPLERPSVDPAQRERASRPPCPHCGSTEYTDHPPHRPGWYRRDCARCGKEIWPMMPTRAAARAAPAKEKTEKSKTE